MSIKFSVAIVTYNASKYIEELLTSIYNQTYNNIEVVYVDGNSSDNTLEIIKKYKQEEDILLSEPDQGVYDAMNKALDLASGDFLIFMGSDDHFLSFRVLEEVANAINKVGDKDSLYYGGCYMDASHVVVNKVQTNWSWIRGTMCHQGIFYPKHIYKKHQYNLKYKINADYAYNLKLWRTVRFQHIDVVISFFNSNGLSGSNLFDMEFRKDLPAMIRYKCGYIPYLYKLLRLTMGRVFKGRPPF